MSKECRNDPETKDCTNDEDGTESESEPSVLQEGLLHGILVGLGECSLVLGLLFLCFLRRRSIIHAA